MPTLNNLKAAFYEECIQQKPQIFLWLPIFVALGIGLYYSLFQEPPLVLGVFAFIAALVWLNLSERLRIPALLCIMVAAGFLSAQIRTHLVHTPILQKDLGPAMVVGTISAIEDLGDGEGSRLVLSRLDVEDLSPEETPVKIRLKVRNDEDLLVGQRIRALSMLHSPSPPVMPGGFDFQRYLYFQRIGAVGFIYRDIEITEGSDALGVLHLIEKWRQSITAVIEKNIDYPQAGIATALMVGRKTAIGKEDKEAMQHAGLAHMLAISGLHVGLFSGVIFFLSRLIMAFIPGFALRHPIKKYAAVIAMTGACFYMLLAGATIPTQRAVLMAGIVFLAIILDRSPISLRLVAFAAFTVLLFFPESLLSASFHMSFAAVTCLVLFYDWLRPYWSGWYRQAGMLRRAGLYFAGVCFTTVVASLATAPFALFHFQTFALYGLAGNLISVPILAFVIMPAVVMALLLMPFQLAFIPFIVVEKGIAAILETAVWVSALPHAVLKVSAWPLESLVLLVAAGLLVGLWKGRLRILFLLPACISFAFILAHKQPDILISSNFKLAAFSISQGSLSVSSKRTERFVAENWARAYGLDPEELELWPLEGGGHTIKCDEQACRLYMKNRMISYIKEPVVAAQECAGADIVLSPEPLRSCDVRLVIDLFDVKDKGAYAVFLDSDVLLVKTAQEARGYRPWSGRNISFQGF